MTRGLISFVAAAALACGQTAPQEDAIRKLSLEGRFTEAEPLARRALADAEARWGTHSKPVAALLDHLLFLSYHSNRISDRADWALAERAIALGEELFGPRSHQLAETLRRAADLAERNEDYARARELLQRSLELHEALPAAADSLLERAEAWNSMGKVLMDTFDYQGAKEVYQRALPLYERACGHRSRYVAVCLNDMAGALMRLGDSAGAKARYLEALRIYDKTVGPNHILVAGCMNNLAFLLTDTGQPAEAAALLQKVLRVARATYGERHPRTAIALTNLADALSASGEYDAADSYYRRAGEIEAALFGPLSRYPASTMNRRSINQALAGRSSQAAGLAMHAEDLVRAFDLIAIRTMPEREALLRADAKASGERMAGLNTLLSLAAAGAPGAPALDELIRSRAVLFDEIAARHRADGNGDPEVARLVSGLAAAREELARLVVDGPRSMTPTQYQASLDRARENKYEAERLLAGKSLPFRREMASRQVGLREVAAVLPEDAALISFVRYPRIPCRLNAPARNPAAKAVLGYMALVLRAHQQEPAVVALGDASTIDAMVAEVRRKIAQEAQDPGRAPLQSEDSYRRAAARLRARIWDPLAAYWKGARRIFIVPDGSLHMVSFAALPVGRAYLADSGLVIHYLSAERDVAAPAPPPAAGGMLVVANPAFDGAPAPASAAARFRGPTAACDAYRNLHFDPLPGAAREAGSLASIWRQAGGAESSLTGSSARKSSVIEQAPGKRVLHLATHGFFLDACSPAANAAPARSGAIENPLLLSGLALAGANDRNHAGDSILTAEEVVSLNLDGLEWAVLSACDSGLGEIHAGEGVFGLRRAFQLAGARTVILSLWPADDNNTRLWMEELYRARFLRGATTADAVRAATLSLLAHRRAAHLSTHPLYWAGFLAAGEWR